MKNIPNTKYKEKIWEDILKKLDKIESIPDEVWRSKDGANISSYFQTARNHIEKIIKDEDFLKSIKKLDFEAQKSLNARIEALLKTEGYKELACFSYEIRNTLFPSPLR